LYGDINAVFITISLCGERYRQLPR
jgi:hypothetical protein